MVLFRREAKLNALLTVRPPEEGHDLRSRAVVAGAEQTAADAGGDAVRRGPRDRLGVPGVRGNIAERGAALCLRAQRTGEEGHSLRAGAGVVWAEQAAADTGGDAVFNRPRDRLGVEAVLVHIAHARRALRLGRAGRAPQEGDDLTAGAGQVGAEAVVSDTAGDAQPGGPLHRLGVPCVRGNIRKGGADCISTKSAETVTGMRQ